MSRAPRGQRSRDRPPEVGAGPLAGAKRRARAPRGGRRRVPGRRLLVSARAPRAGRAAARRGPGARRALGTLGRSGRQRVRVVEAGRGGADRRQPLEPRQLRGALPAEARRRAGRRLRRAARARFRRAVVVGRGDRLRHPRGAKRRPDRLRPVARGHPRRTVARGGGTAETALPRRSERRVPPAQARLPAAGRRTHAHPAAGGRRRLAPPPRPCSCGTPRRDTSRPRDGLPDELREELGVTVEPRLEGEPLDGARARGG